MIRCESGLLGNSFGMELEMRKINYVTVLRFYPTIKNEVCRLTNWTSIKDGVEICVFYYQPTDWKSARKMVAVRKNILTLKKATGKLLLFDEQIQTFRYSVFVTNLNLPAQTIWEIIKKRGDAENRIKELK